MDNEYDIKSGIDDERKSCKNTSFAASDNKMTFQNVTQDDTKEQYLKYFRSTNDKKKKKKTATL